MDYISKVIDHLGIVSGVCREIHLAEEINRMVGVNDQQKVTTGDAVLAMVINALGFTSKPLYLFPGFMHNKPVELLIREDLKPEDFNDDTLGRALDRLYQNNPTQIFMHIALKAAKLIGAKKKFLHLDTTTMSVHGQYQQQEKDEMTPITITYGRPGKNGRNGLKQFIVSLITLSQSDLPIWLNVLSGNSSDKNHFPEVIKKFSKELAAGDGEEVYYVMDSALYSEDNIREVSPLVKWISRVPENISEAKRLIQECEAEKMAKSSLEGYKHQAYRSNYGGVEQKQ
ncbi:MAG: IS1634 family transposase [Candidatus Freyarchaeota archaeon]|nr:IS1634 family transposase [Candidatus Jordarchaeia archaeon]